MEEINKLIEQPITRPLNPLRRIFILTPTGRQMTKDGKVFTEVALPSGARYAKDVNGVLRRLDKKRKKRR